MDLSLDQYKITKTQRSDGGRNGPHEVRNQILGRKADVWSAFQGCKGALLTFQFFF